MSTSTVSATSTLAMVLAARNAGVAVEPLLRQVGLDPALLESPGARIPLSLALGLWDELREEANDPTLQLAAPLSVPYGAYRVLEYLVSSSSTVGEGVRRFAKYFRLITAQVGLEIESTETEAFMTASLAEGGAVPPVYVDYIFAALVTRVRMRPRPGLLVARVELRRREPDHAASYVAVFRAPIVFGSDRDRLCFTREEWESPMTTHDATLAEILDEHARARSEALAVAGARDLEEVRGAIVEWLPSGAPIDRVARSMGLSVRSLQRRLADAGTTYSAVLEKSRRRLAEAYLEDGRTSIGEAALLLGFSDQTSFHRAFRRWTGEAPGRFRRRRRDRLVPSRG